MFKKIILLVCLPILSFSQVISGKIIDASTQEPIIGATVFWTNAPSKGVATDIEGKFSIQRLPKAHQLKISAIGYQTDSIMAHTDDFLEIKLKESSQALNEVVVKGQSTVLDRLSPIQTEIITTKTLAKAACCNLSESFETNASVSVSYSDAVTGAKQIRLLGLSGNYVQTNIENIPSIRGLASTFGLNYVPGTWIQSIDIAKGIGSVVNGYESMSGGINVELMKPENSEKLYINTYLNSLGRGELNVNAAHKISDKWSLGLLSHGSFLQRDIEKNQDDFLDIPKYKQLNFLNRWKYQSERFVAQFGLKYLQEDRQGGQIGFVSNLKTPQLYGFTNETNRVEFISKTAVLFPEKPYRGLALILNAAKHNSVSTFGKRGYDATQDYAFANLIYQGILGNTQHKFATGLNFVYDKYDELFGSISLKREEIVPGVYFEYTYNNLDKTVLVIGNRIDFHNLFGIQFNPRVHFKQVISESLIWRASVGSGFRVSNRLAEYYGNLVSNRQVVFLTALSPEKSWNFGTSFTKTFGKNSLIMDFYRTEFTNKMIADAEHPAYLYFYNSKKKAYANAFQIEYNAVLNSRVEAKIAYRFLDTKQTIGDPFDEEVLLPVMFQSPSRVLFNIGYALPYDKWKADVTLSWNSSSRIPTTDFGYDHTSYTDMPINKSPDFFNLNAQVTRTFINWEYYIGGENLANFRQLNPIIDPFKPFGNNFDAGMNWGPVVGRIIYFGTRYRIR